MNENTRVRIRTWIALTSWYIVGVIVGSSPGLTLGDLLVALFGGIFTVAVLEPVIRDAVEQRLTREEKRDRVRP